jgi:hypothetical protein
VQTRVRGRRAQGTLFSVRWGTDEEGRLVPVDTREARRVLRRTVPVLCPPGAAPGDVVEAEVEGVRTAVTVPEGVRAGESFEVAVAQPDGPGPDTDPAAPAECGSGAGHAVTVADVQARVLRLQTPLAVQVRRAGAGPREPGPRWRRDSRQPARGRSPWTTGVPCAVRRVPCGVGPRGGRRARAARAAPRFYLARGRGERERER